MPLGKPKRLCLNGWFEMQVHGTVRLESFQLKKQDSPFPTLIQLVTMMHFIQLDSGSCWWDKVPVSPQLRLCANLCFLTSCSGVLGKVLLVYCTTDVEIRYLFQQLDFNPWVHHSLRSLNPLRTRNFKTPATRLECGVCWVLWCFLSHKRRGDESRMYVFLLKFSQTPFRIWNNRTEEPPASWPPKLAAVEHKTHVQPYLIALCLLLLSLAGQLPEVCRSVR